MLKFGDHNTISEDEGAFSKEESQDERAIYMHASLCNEYVGTIDFY
jgi:hypothetical protein